MGEPLGFIRAISSGSKSLLSLLIFAGSGWFKLIVWVLLLPVTFGTWMMLWLVVMSQPLGQSRLRRPKLHSRMLTLFAGAPVPQRALKLGRASC